MRLRLGVPAQLSAEEKKAVLDAALESVTRANEGLISRGLPTFAEAGPGRRFKWKPEPPGDEHFDLGSTVLSRGWGDCDDLAPWHAASLRVTGADPEARAIVVPSASGVPGRWHAIVERSGGELEDPSLAAGMRGSVHGDAGVLAPFWAPMRADRLAVAAHPLAYPGRGYAARVDIPSLSVPAVYSGLAAGNTPAAAVCGAIGPLARVCGEDADEDQLVQLAGVHDLLMGASPREVAEAFEAVYGEDAVGFLPFAASLAAPFAGKALQTGLGMLGMGPKGGGGAAPAGGGGAAPAGGGAPHAGYYGPGLTVIRF